MLEGNPMKRTAWIAVVLATFSLSALAQRGGGAGAGMGRGSGTGRGGGGATGQTTSAGRTGSAAPRAGTRQFSAAPGVVSGTARVTPGFGQVFTPNTFGSVSGFGNVLFPGTGHAPGAFTPFSQTFGGNPAGGFRRFGRGATTVILPYAVPIYGAPYAAPYAPEDPQAYAGYAPAQAPPPQVIYIVPAAPNGNAEPPAQPQSSGPMIYNVPPRENGSTESVAPAGKRVYLIAVKNSSIYSATDYWVENDTLHYITPTGAHNQISMDQLDLDFTVRLNRERGIDFLLPK
jgi:hypothetical protein